jgi:hypothetical protein
MKARRTFADDFGRWLERADELAVTARVATEDASSRLLHYLLDERYHPIILVAQPLRHHLFITVVARLSLV